MSWLPKKDPPRLSQLMVRPESSTWAISTPSYLVPAVNIAQLGVNQMKAILAYAPSLEEGDSASFTVTTTLSKRDGRTELHSVSVELESESQKYTFLRRVN